MPKQHHDDFWSKYFAVSCSEFIFCCVWGADRNWKRLIKCGVLCWHVSSVSDVVGVLDCSWTFLAYWSLLVCLVSLDLDGFAGIMVFLLISRPGISRPFLFSGRAEEHHPALNWRKQRVWSINFGYTIPHLVQSYLVGALDLLMAGRVGLGSARHAFPPAGKMLHNLPHKFGFAMFLANLTGGPWFLRGGCPHHKLFGTVGLSGPTGFGQPSPLRRPRHRASLDWPPDELGNIGRGQCRKASSQGWGWSLSFVRHLFSHINRCYHCVPYHENARPLVQLVTVGCGSESQGIMKPL